MPHRRRPCILSRDARSPHVAVAWDPCAITITGGVGLRPALALPPPNPPSVLRAQYQTFTCPSFRPTPSSGAWRPWSWPTSSSRWMPSSAAIKRRRAPSPPRRPTRPRRPTTCARLSTRSSSRAPGSHTGPAERAGGACRWAGGTAYCTLRATSVGACWVQLHAVPHSVVCFNTCPHSASFPSTGRSTRQARMLPAGAPLPRARRGSGRQRQPSIFRAAAIQEHAEAASSSGKEANASRVFEPSGLTRQVQGSSAQVTSPFFHRIDWRKTYHCRYQAMDLPCSSGSMRRRAGL